MKQKYSDKHIKHIKHIRFSLVSDVEESCFFDVELNTLLTTFNFTQLQHGTITYFILYYNSMVS